MGCSLYILEHPRSDRYYIGVTKGTLVGRLSSHKWAANAGLPSYVYCWARKYGVEDLKITLLHEYATEVLAYQAEERVILSLWKLEEPLTNLHQGGLGGYKIPDDKKEEWKEKLRAARKGRRPALGMKHTDENKKLFSEVSNTYWATQETYNPKEVLQYGFIKAHEVFGISKTHYYRLRRQSPDIFTPTSPRELKYRDKKENR